MLSVFSHCMTNQNGCEKNKDVLELQHVSCLLSGENESRNSANTGKEALFFQMQASSDPVSLQSDVSLSVALFGCNFTKYTHFPFNIQVRFMRVVNLKVRWSNWHMEIIMVIQFECKILKMWFLMLISVSIWYKLLWCVCWAHWHKNQGCMCILHSFVSFAPSKT